jgi:flagellar hook protein FlgE
MIEAANTKGEKSMLRSMYSGISGMKNFQTKLDVIGNNIANVNTYGFKKGRVVFKDMINQNISGASAAGDSRGGVNAKQIGLGSQISTIDTIHTTGSLQSTGRVLDLAVSGSGFFQVTDASGGETLYTRAGNFYLDESGDLVTGDGFYLSPKINIPTDAKSMSIGQDGTVNYVDKDGVLTSAGQLQLAKFPNDGGLEKAGGNYFKETTNSGAAFVDSPGVSGIGTIESGFLEMSNVDLSEEFTEMITAQRGFQANTRIITTSDEILQELVNLKR